MNQVKFWILVFVFVALISYFVDAHADDMCLESIYGGTVTLTVLPCPVTTNPMFYRAYYTQTDGIQGEGCWMKDRGRVMVIWKDHPTAHFPVSDFGKCKEEEK